MNFDFLVRRIGAESVEAEVELSVRMPNRSFMTTVRKGRVVLQFGDHDFELVAAILPLAEFDVILGMDWLAEQRASIDCQLKVVTLRGEGRAEVKFEGLSGVACSLISTMQVMRAVNQGGEAFIALLKKIQKN